MHPNKQRKKNNPPPSLPVWRQHEAPTHVEHPGENDVLLGRGRPFINHIGNRRYRELVKSRKEDYRNSSRSRAKSMIAQEILECIRERGGRFLQLVTSETRDEDPNIPRAPRLWSITSRDVALSKIKQSLRDREHVRSSDRQREAVVFINQQMQVQQASNQLPVYSPLQAVPPTSFTQAQPPPILHLSSQPVQPSINLSDLAFLQHLRSLDQHRLEFGAQTQMIHRLTALRATTEFQARQLLPVPNITQISQLLLQSSDAQRVLQFLQFQRGIGGPSMPLPPAANPVLSRGLGTSAGPFNTSEVDRLLALSSDGNETQLAKADGETNPRSKRDDPPS